MDKKEYDPTMLFTEMIAKDKKLLEEQLLKVKEEYPLVIFAYRLQQAVISELSMPRLYAEADLGSLYAAIDSDQAVENVIVKQKQRMADLKDCLRRAHTSGASSGEVYRAGVACFERYVAGDDRDRVDDD